MKYESIRSLLWPRASWLAALALGWGATTIALGDDIVWVGYQYGSPGPPGDGWWRTDASWFHEDNWRNFHLPTPGDPEVIDDGDIAVFDDREDDFIPHVVHFGDFTVSADPPGINQPIHVPGGDARVERLDVRDGDYTFDFSPGSSGPQGSLTVDRLIRVGTLDEHGAGDASLTIVGGRLSQSTWENWEGLVVGDGIGTTGRLVVRGAGAELDLMRSAAIGNGGGDGSLEVLDGGVVRSFAIGSGGAFYGPNGELSTTRIVADGAGSEILGLANVNNGTLSITNGAHVSSKMGDGTLGYAFLGLTDGAHSVALVDGPGSRWDDIGHLTVGLYQSEGSARSELSIRDGGVVEAGALAVGNRNTQGTIAIDGFSSAMRIEHSSAVGVGGGVGSLSVTNGAVFEAESINIGITGGVGSVSAAGGSEIRIGIHSAALGWDEGSAGELHLSGGSRLVDGGGLIVGNLGAGTLTIQGGSTAESTYGQIGVEAGGQGSATVEAEGSRWDAGRSLVVGGNVGVAEGGSGLLVVRDGAAVTVSDLLETWNGGTVDVHDGGRLLVGAGDVGSVAEGRWRLARAAD